MDSMIFLSTLLSKCEQIDSPRKLQTAVFLAQKVTGTALYQYRLSLGKVLSDSLDQDIAGLEAIGMLRPACETETRKRQLQVRTEEALGSAPLENHREFYEVFNSLFREQGDILEGAATMCRFRERPGAASPEDLLWFRSLGVGTRSSAIALCERLELHGSRPRGEDVSREEETENVTDLARQLERGIERKSDRF